MDENQRSYDQVRRGYLFYGTSKPFVSSETVNEDKEVTVDHIRTSP